MAEARAACHPVPAIGLHTFRVDPTLHQTQVAVSSDGFVLYIPHPYFIWKGLKRAFHSTRTQVQTLLWPLRPRLVVGFVCSFSAYVSSKDSSHWLRSGKIAETLWKVDSKLPFTKWLPTPFRVAYLSLTTAAGIIVSLVFVQKTLLRFLLSYHEWLFEGRKVSTTTKVWGSILKYGYLNRGLLAGKPLLYAFQSALPSLKAPPVESTVKDYLNSMEPLCKPEEFQTLQKDATAFLAGPARTLQSYLWMKSLITRNYVTDWWVKFVYLRGRTPLFINSNFYGIGDGPKDLMPSQKQLPRAACWVYYWLLARQLVDRERLPPLCINGMVPLCMDQYRSAFNSVRVPGLECDRLQVYDMDESRHIVVQYKGHYYSLVPYSQGSGRLLAPVEIQRQLEGIVNAHDESERDDTPDKRIAALTTLDRTKWASIRENYLLDGKHNRNTLDQIERAMFLVSLDDEEPEGLTDISRDLFLADGARRWCDKSFTAVIFKNGRVGIHTEHTWADAPVIAHILEWTLAMELTYKDTTYTPEGDLRKDVFPLQEAKATTWSDVKWQIGKEVQVKEKILRPAQKLQWRVPRGLAAEIDAATASARAAMDDLDLLLWEFADYGKGLVKKAKVSPDAWIQMALQLAYFRDQGRFDLTYESSMTRLFAEGRTETIRSCTTQSCAWVRSMDDPNATKEQRLDLLREATEQHTVTSRKAMVGKGVDRHMFAMYVVAVGKGIEADFVKNAVSLPYKLSTSQVPQRQLPKGAWPNADMGDKHYTPSGGFGPVADDGYGVSYCLCGDLRFFFHVSSKKACSSTDSERMQGNIRKALKDMELLA
eukprot:TRINITY_DN8835_c0_g1_i1.p2 TRINITY_DN8835_c0_g1~~TRINITY_DN8835_c0_g1_i1.p2  ORF type:complete len:821 (+),score=385.82 TRINITY_DN8835_c0_g1_i1:45-2507(+)